MIADITFISTEAYSPSSNRAPIFTSGAGVAYVTGQYTIEDVKCNKDLEQVITVPEFENYELYNVVQINDIYYGIKAFTHSTYHKNSLDVAISALGVTSILSKSPNHGFFGYLTRSPELKMGFAEDIGAGKESFVRSVDLPKIGKIGGEQLFWCEITLKGKLPTTAAGSFTQGGVHRYGCFIYGDVQYDIDIDPSYPSLREIINSDGMKYAGADVIDIAVSVRCPYKYEITTAGTTMIRCVNAQGNTFLPTHYVKHVTTPWTYSRLMYTLMDESGTDSVPVPADPITADYNIGKLLTAEFNTYRVNIKNENDHVVVPIAREYLKQGSLADGSNHNYDLNIVMRTYSDISGIYTELTIGESTIIINEGKIPWSSTAYDEYRAYSMNYDRQLIAEDSRFAKEQMVTGIVEGAVSGAALGIFTGNPVAAIGTAAGGAISSAITQGISNAQKEQHARNQQELKETNMQAQPGTAYQPAYGLNYLTQNLVRTLRIAVTKFSPEGEKDIIGFPCSELVLFNQGAIIWPGLYRMKGIYSTEAQGIPQTYNKLLTERAIQELASGIYLSNRRLVS